MFHYKKRGDIYGEMRDGNYNMKPFQMYRRASGTNVFADRRYKIIRRVNYSFSPETVEKFAVEIERYLTTVYATDYASISVMVYLHNCSYLFRTIP